ncbi:MAG: ribosome biogenesis GTPase Der [Desulfobacteraceae bacterium]|nr:ribosome biogenesis GTPase Der [Desulfobacteraceae bacterium]
MKPIVAIIGRPNVGKSSFFNRITRSKDALVDNFPGVTRDRHYRDVTWEDTEFTLIDTGGYLEEDTDDFAAQIRFQIDQAIEDADVIVLMLDGKNGISPFDTDIIAMIRSVEKPVFYVVNKIDSIEQEVNLYDFYTLGIEKLFPVSAEHGYGVYDFLDALVQTFPESSPVRSQDIVSIAVVGKPNVGKSSLINRILGEDRLLVSDVPGTTRDAIDSVCNINKKSYLLIDTAGIRRKSRVSKKIEKFSIIKALRSLDRCDTALIIIDADNGVTDQDISIAGYAYERGCGCILVLNKWDIIEKDSKTAKKYYDRLRTDAKFLSFAPVITISALTGLRVSKIFKLADEVYAQYSKRAGTGQLNKILETAIERNEPSLHKGKRIKFYYGTQVSVKPPTFVCFVNYPEAVHFSYKRYLINQIRDGLGLDKTPIRMIFRQRTGRIEFDKKSRR